MSSPPLFISQISSNLLTNQHRLQSTLHCSQETDSSPCSSSSSNSLVNGGGGEKEVIVKVSDGYCTPTSPERRILASVNCPPAPKKPRVCRRRVVRLFSYLHRNELVHDLGLVMFKEIRCLQKRKKEDRGRQGIAK